MKNIRIFLSENFHFLVVKFSVYLNRHVFVKVFTFNARVLQKVLSLGLDYFRATFYPTYFYYKPSKYSPFTETHFCNLFTQKQINSLLLVSTGDTDK